MENMPVVKIGLVAVSRDCFPASLAVNRRKALIEAYKKNFNDKDVATKTKELALEKNEKSFAFVTDLYR